MEDLARLSTKIVDRLCAEMSDPRLVMSAHLHVSGPRVSVPFVLTRCSRFRRPGRLKWKWEAKVADEKDYETPINVFELENGGTEAASEWLANVFAKALRTAAREHYVEGSGVLSVTLS
jgi:hypothetical protein